MKIQCCVCSRIRLGERWRLAIDGELDGERLSSSYCSPCAAEAVSALRKGRSEQSGMELLVVE